MKRIILGIILSVFMILMSCDEKILFVKCADCTDTEPVEASLEVKLDNFVDGISVMPQVRIYEGNIEDSILLGTYNVIDVIWEHTVPVNKKYTLTATYNTGKATYVAVDSTTPRVRYETQQCENPCYYIYGKSLNLRIKYTK
jgi:hypothetical protein